MNVDMFHFVVFMAVSSLVFVAVLHLVLRKRRARPSLLPLVAVAGIVNVGGMCFAKVGANAGWPVWLYYGLPAAMTVFLAPVIFRMSSREATAYIVLASLMAPAIHVSFSLLLGWKEYLPFWAVPSLRELTS